MATLTKAEIAALSVDERLALIDDLWQSLEYNTELLPAPDWHKEELDRRLEEAERSPQTSIPWEEVKARLESKWLR